MVPKIGASYVLKKVADYVTTPPPQPAQRQEDEEAEPAAPRAARAPALVDTIHGLVITDENGQAVGTARRVPGVAVYVISPAYANITAEFERALDDPETRLFFHREDDRLVGLIYVPDPSHAPAAVAGMRADDI
ncbi:MAG: hypothetical protein ACRDJH_08150 [Thermomicrobiales bacterium]